MKEDLAILHRIFTTTKHAIEDYMKMLDPAIKNATDDHERLYFHHIYEEEEHRLQRLAELIPFIEKFQKADSTIFSPSNREFNHLLQELKLEKFGLHNFIEHVDLALYQFTDKDRQEQLKEMLEDSKRDYEQVKDLLDALNDRLDQDEVTSDEEKVHKNIKGFTVGSLIH